MFVVLYFRAESAIQSPELLPLVQLTNEVGPGKYQMPNEIYRKFVRAVICVGSCCEEEQRREQYWDQILGPLLVRFRQFITLSVADRHRDDVRLELSCVLSGFIGKFNLNYKVSCQYTEGSKIKYISVCCLL